MMLAWRSAVEATPVARRFYEQCGTKTQIEEMRFDIGEESSTRRKPTLILLMRGPESLNVWA
ncbi:hypothetical protein K458DRAFT_1265 [Lentithecium fluviatile CBS 122367]|uniref:Uncharacterized protein n=1 Tax=Lentithecium fluviatile CBS 122367 TaxID=1168545 RepID=A0A6G1JMW0_9PLEO|nr:hypothetical protein K458DRAFT_1265 [Lentithecium fluviatile CBS 122367]